VQLQPYLKHIVYDKLLKARHSFQITLSSNEQFCRDKIHADQKIKQLEELPCLVIDTGQHGVTSFQNSFNFVVVV
jgi:hypothetical protein